MNKLRCPHGHKDEFKEGPQEYFYLIKFKTFQAIGNPVNTTKQGLDAGWLYSVFQVRILSQSSLVHNGHLTKEEREEEEREGVGRKTVPHRGGMSSVNRP